MVMKRKNMMGRNLTQTIRRSLGRYIAILAIVALGAGLFCGLRVTKVDMVATVQNYTDKQNMFDLQVMNSYGWTDDNVAALSGSEGISDAEGSISQDTLLHFGDNDDKAFKLITLPERINVPSLAAGRLPENPNECLLDGFFFGEHMLGKTVFVSPTNDGDTLENLACREFTVVGLANTPLYLNMQRGSTTIGSGSLTGFLYVPRDAFSLELYTEINLTLPGDYAVYSDRYNDAMDDTADLLEPAARTQADSRWDTIVNDAWEEYGEGRQEYLDGMAEYREEKANAEAELADALQELTDGEQELADGKQELADGRSQLWEAQQTVDENRQALADAQKELDKAKTDAYAQLDAGKQELDDNYAQVAPALEQVEDGLTQIEDGLTQLEDGIAQIDDGLVQINDGIAQLEDAIAQLDDGLAQLEEALPLLDAAAEVAQGLLDLLNALPVENAERIEEIKAQLQNLIDQREEYTRQQEELIALRPQLAEQLEQLYTQREELTAQREMLATQRDEVLAQQAELLETKAVLDDAMAQISDGYAQLKTGYAEADTQFADAQAQIDDGLKQLHDAQVLLDEQWITLAEGEAELADAEQTLADGWQEYYDGKAEAESEFAKAEAELADARQELADARADIEAIEKPSLYILTRNTNLGYVVFESDSNIVAGVAKIFPVFFLAVAALVCITTMTRMIDEERTQIGILKALGYSSGAIMGKYLAYSGSACLLGCLLGLLLGSTLFPNIIWYAYCIMYDFSDQLTLSYDIGTILFIFISYLGLTMLVTWNCCRRELQDVPAELIRPRPPVSGKQIFLEKLPFWKHLKFLNKVAIRNIFRYRQRLAMMLLGIGGCTALLVTGFGIGDSISDIVSYQFEQVTLYDIGVTFSEELTPEDQADFWNTYPEQEILFCYQGGIDVDYDNTVKNVNFLVTDTDLEGFIDLHTGDTPIPMPGTNEALISIGAATAMDMEVGDTVILRNADLEELTVTVSGIYDNNVYNYAIVSGDTIRAQWGREPEFQTAFVLASEGQEVHELGAALASYDGILSLAINQDTADTVGSMMDALDAIIVVIVICAGLLAGIVLYNLTNINIQERIREIATIKVLGFNAGETASYVFKENLTLTVVGTLLGLWAGKWLHTTVMSYVRIDMVWFDNRINPDSYLIAAVLTILAALMVDLVMYFKLDKINMAEALKSVE